MKDDKKEHKSKAPLIGLAAVCVICAFALGYMVKDLASGSKANATPAPAAGQPGALEGATLGPRFKALEDNLKQNNQQALIELRKEIRKMAFDRRVADLNSDMPVQMFNLDKLHSLPSHGPENAVITLVEFSDFQCPYCSRTALYIEEVMKQNPDKIRLIFVDRPLTSIHPYAYTAHEAAAEAKAQGKFWEFYTYIFTNQKTIFPAPPKSKEELDQNLKTFRESMVAAAGEVGLDQGKMAQSLETHSRKAELDQRIAIADSMQINSTPTVYSNAYFLLSDPSMVSKMISGAVSLE